MGSGAAPHELCPQPLSTHSVLPDALPDTPKTRKVPAAVAHRHPGLCSEPFKGCSSLQKKRVRTDVLSGFLDDERDDNHTETAKSTAKAL